MKPSSISMSLVVLLTSLGYGAWGATISGTVKDPSGASLKGAFVRAQNEKSKMTVSVLSDRQGRYQIQDLPSGEYMVRATAVGYKSEPRTGVKLAAAETASLDFALQKGLVRWSDLSNYQGRMLLPDANGKKELVGSCFACHGFQSRMAGNRRDEDGWRRAVSYMKEDFGFFVGLRDDHFTVKNVADVTAYLNSTFGLDSDLPRSPAELPRYNEVKHPEFSDEAMKIVYADFELPDPGHFPGAGHPDKDGYVWTWNLNVNRLSRLDPKTGEIKEWPVPNPTRAAIHSVTPTADGTLWFTESSSWVNKVGKFDPATEKITEYKDPQTPGEKHTCVVDLQGNVWSTGAPLSKFDPKTGKFTEYPEVPSAYGIDVDQQGNVWFSEMREDGKIGKVDAKTGKITKWLPPTPRAYPRRMKIDPEGMVWFAEYQAGKIGRFSPKTGAFKEYQLPGSSPTPYALALDRKNHVWYSSMDMDVIGQLDPATGAVVEYPFPYAENGMRDFFMDSQGRLWWATQANNRVGYFSPIAGNGTVPVAGKGPAGPQGAPNQE